MKNNKYIIIGMAMFFILCIGCDDFGDVNIDPNNTTEVAPETLLTSSQRVTRWIAQSYPGNLYAQYFSQTTYTDVSLYQFVNYNFNFWYADGLINLEEIIRMNTNEDTREIAQASGSNNNQIAVARILKAYYFHYLTDRWGPLPYSEALKGRTDFKPVYDSQEDIYRGIFKELEEAVVQSDNGPTVKGDILLDGDMQHWKTFANSIRLIAALRLSKINPTLGREQFNAALANGVISSNQESVFYKFLPEANNENPWYSRFRVVDLEGVSNILIDRLKELNDPRLYSYADPALSNSEYWGMPYGVENPSTDPADISLPHSEFVRGQDTPLPLMTYAQMLFSMAEAAQLGWINQDAEQLYYDAIKASIEQWFAYDVDSFNDYISQPLVIWNDQEALKLIGEQKWIALYTQGYEAWAEWRRTGYPDLQPAPDALNDSGQIPLRQGYPTTERDLNSDNWMHAVDTWLGGVDGLDSGLWWDVD